MMLICSVSLATGVCTHSTYSAQLNYILVNEFTLFCHSVPRGEITTQMWSCVCLPQINTYFLKLPESFDAPCINQAGGVNVPTYLVRNLSWLFFLSNSQRERWQ